MEPIFDSMAHWITHKLVTCNYLHREKTFLVESIERFNIGEKMRKEDTVKLISAEGFEFIIDKKAAMVSQTIRNMLTSPGASLFAQFILGFSNLMI